MMRIALIGTGNLAIHMAQVFKRHKEISCVQWIGRKMASPLPCDSLPYFNTFQSDIAIDVCILAISDDQIVSVAEALPKHNFLIVHTSGAVSKNVMDSHSRTGVFYPLQSFLKDSPIDWNDIPLCIEADTNKDIKILNSLAAYFGNNTHQISEDQRLRLHTAAVYVNNFCTHLLATSKEITNEAKLPFSLLKPLIKETFMRSNADDILSMQTGPAKRNDTVTQNKHIQVLDSNQATLYRILSESIFKTHNT